LLLLNRVLSHPFGRHKNVSRELALHVLLIVLAFSTTGFGKTKTRKARSPRPASSEQARNPVRLDEASANSEATLERLSQEYLHSPDTQTQKNLTSFCETSRDRSLAGLAYFLIGFNDLQRDKLDGAEEFLRKAVSYPTPIDDYSQYYWGETLVRRRRFEEAHAALKNYLSKFSEGPLREKALSNYWEASVVLNRPQAILESVQWLSNKPEDPEWLYYLAQAQESLDQKQEALKSYQKVYYRFPFYEKNLSVFQRSASLLASNPQLKNEIPKEWRTARIEKLIQGKQWSEALKDLELLAQVDPAFAERPQFLLWLGISQFGSGRYPDAIETLRKVNFSDAQKNSEAIFYIAESYRKLEDYRLFKESVETLVEKFPKSVWCENALFSIGNYNLVRRNMEESMNFYQEIVDLFPTGLHATDSHWRVSWRLYRLKNYDRACAMFVDHLARFPDSDNRMAASYWAARCKEALGQPGEAFRIYQALHKRSAQSYYGRLSQEQMASLKEAAGTGQTASPELEQILKALTKNERISKPADLSLLEKTSWRTWPRVKALGLIQLFDQAARELLRPQVYGEAPAVYFQAAQLYYRGKNFLPAISNLRRVFPNYLETPLEGLPKSIWEVFFPVNFASILFKEAERQKVDPYLLLALIRQESGFDPQALSVANAHGLMQLVPATARFVAKGMKMRPPSVARLRDPEVNIPLGTKYFSDLLRRFDGQSDKALAGYNAGEDRVEAWMGEGGFADSAEFVETIPFTQTRNYVKTIDRNYWFYKRLYGDR
jgi:soluble lytic murein transglycosylase